MKVLHARQCKPQLLVFSSVTFVLYDYWSFYNYVSATNNRQQRYYVFGSSVRLSVHLLSVCPLSIVRSLTPISRDAISLYKADGFQWNLAQMFIMRVGITEKVFMVRGQRSRSYVYTNVWMLLWQRHVFRWCDVKVHLFLVNHLWCFEQILFMWHTGTVCTSIIIYDWMEVRWIKW